jgi:PEP-CTERM motif
MQVMRAVLSETKRRRSMSFGVLVLTAFLGCSVATAGIINIGNGATGTDPKGTSCPPCDPVLVGTGSDLSIEVQGSASITNKVLLILLIPNDTTDIFGGIDPLGTITTYPSFPGAAGPTGSSAFTGTGFGLGTGSATYLGNGFWGDFSGPSSAKLSAFLDTNLNSSNNMSNFLGFDNTTLGLSTTQFGVYTIAITTGPLSPNKGKVGLVDIQIPGGLKQGSIAIALDDNLDSTVWTNDAGVDGGGGGGGGGGGSVPEPSSIVLLGSGLLLACSKLRKKLARS